ncbi:MAG: methylmalonyl-CoA mutase family protein, partial [Desulfatiglandales bacterium]
AVKRQKELDSGKKLVVGVNIFTTEQEKTTPLGVQRVPEQSAKQQVKEIKELKRTRDTDKLKDAIERLKNDTGEGKNVIPAMVEATKTYGTTGELLGTVREVFGYTYDPMETVESPFK